ncbi:OmpA family protein [Variovorax boronicumulans]|uniref:OmpA family protein n=1 Tax=Variovorax boronicumulans TaxID=436515 RepID=UPI0027D87274|nr:OmpA family protein [Variovorax boronicumulans]
MVRKNYKIGSNWDVLLARFGFNLERYGTVLGSDETERLVQFDNLCRAYATGEMDSDTWAKIHEGYVLASVKAAQNNNSEAAQSQLKSNIDRLHELSVEFARLKGEKVPASTSTEDVLRRASELSHSKIQEQFDSFKKLYGDKLSTNNESLRNQIVSVSSKLDGLQAMLQGVYDRTKPVDPSPPPTKPTALPAWNSLPTFRVEFSINEATLGTDAQAVLRRNLSRLTNSPNFRLELDGYTDASGSARSNARLSVARATEVRDFLVNGLLLDSSKIFAAGRAQAPARLTSGAAGRVVEIRGQVYEAPLVTPAASTSIPRTPLGSNGGS